MIADLLKILNSYSIELHGKPLAYVNGQGFFLIETYRDENTGTQKYLLTSLDGTTTLFDLPEGQKLFRLDSEKNIAELMRNVVGTSALHGRNVFGTLSEHYRFVVGNTELSESQQRIAEKYNIEDLSQQYENAFLKQILQELRKLTIESIERATKNKKGKREILLIWEQVRAQAAENNIVELEDLRDKLLRLAGKQKRGENASLIREAKREIREEVWGKVTRTLKIWTTVIVFFTLLITSSILFFRKSKPIYTQSKDNVEQSIDANKKSIDEYRISKAISIHNSTSSIKIYRWRKEKITQYILSNYTTLSDNELQNVVDTLATTQYPFWKNIKTK